MDELDLIRSFRADTAPPSALATARAERAWRRPEPRRPRWTGRVAIAACVAAAATAAALVIPGERDTRLGTPEASAAAATLRLAAKSQQGGLARPLRPGEFFYVRTKTAWGIDHPGVRESWAAIDGTRRWRDRGEDHRVGPSKDGPFYIGNESMTYAELLDLPRGAEALHARLRQAAVDCECGHSVDHETFVIVGDLLRENPIPADLEAALLRSAALIPGITLIE
ncbi:MAG TPA: CU044_5270 family protein, partial [Thermoleophilaceae bacterium]|nr:CU044_5270 family protein [Thermoleophilaceae bacterium]